MGIIGSAFGSVNGIDIEIISQYFDDYIVPRDNYAVVYIDLYQAEMYDLLDWYDNDEQDSVPFITYDGMVAIVPPSALENILDEHYVWSEDNAISEIESYLMTDIKLPDGIELDIEVVFYTVDEFEEEVEEVRFDLYTEEEA
jgi:hypothetical protein